MKILLSAVLALSLGACAMAPSTNPKAQLVQQCGAFLQGYTAADQALKIHKLPVKYQPIVDAAYKSAGPVCTDPNSLNNASNAMVQIVTNALNQLPSVAVSALPTPTATSSTVPLTSLTVPAK